jgi:Flp pilus assembly pilin Flp
MKSRNSEAGQMLVEYVLLLVVAITIAFLIRSTLVKTSADPESSGAVQQRWNSLGNAIGNDDPGVRTQ